MQVDRKYGWSPHIEVAKVGAGGSLIGNQGDNETQQSNKRVRKRPASAGASRKETVPNAMRASPHYPQNHTRSTTRHLLNDAPQRRAAVAKQLAGKEAWKITPGQKSALMNLPDKNKEGYCGLGLCGHPLHGYDGEPDHSLEHDS